MRHCGLRLAIIVPDLRARFTEVTSRDRAGARAGCNARGGTRTRVHGFEIAAAGALSTQPLVAAALESIAAFVRGGDLQVASRAVRCAFLAGGAVELRRSCEARRADPPQRSAGSRSGTACRACRARHCPRLGAALGAGLDLAAAWPRRALPSQWSQHWARFLGAVGWPGDGLDTDGYQARERWQRLLMDFGCSDDCTGPMSPGAALALLRDQGDSVLFEPQQRSAALTIIDPETCAGMSFDGLWVCGLDSARWPAPASPDPFLPREWQVLRGMPGASADIAAADARRVLQRLCDSADEVILSVPQFQGDAPLLPSPLLAGVPRGVVAGAWDALRPTEAMYAARPGLERCVDGAMPAVERGTAAAGGSRLLELASACPFRAQAELRLGARALEEPVLGVAATERGELVHGVLARIWGSLGSQQALRALTPEQISAKVRDAVASESAAALATAQGVMRRLLEIEIAWLKARVSELLAHDIDRGPFDVDAVEKDLSLELGGLSFALRVDRVDRLTDGGLAVIDYKTGADADPSSWLGERPRLPQLPLYAEAIGADRVSAMAFGRVRTGDTGYRGLARGPDVFPGLASPGVKPWPREHDSWRELQHAWNRRLGQIASEYAAGDARLAPDPSTACGYCHLAALCRIGEAGEPGEGGDD